MLQAILVLASNGLGLVKKYWQVTAGAVAVIAAFIFKRNYDSKIKKETLKDIENVARETAALEQAALSSASEAVTISHMSNPLPVSWAEFERLSEKVSKSPKAKAAKDKFLKRVRRKN